MERIRLKKEELLFDMPLYAIYMVLGDGWYVANKTTYIAKRFGFEKYTSYLDVIDYADSIC